MPPPQHHEPWLDLHRAVANERRATLLAEAEAERLVRRSAGGSGAGLRRSVGHVLIRIGRTIADEPSKPRLRHTT